ncbi:MAG: ferritin family protein [Candidatus Omnitrophica bacterium]|nr:ferritin family protein [Candidatus Omnitrophota bacterium]MBU1047071.1 ferritin family protein [Candidatus Omnitrophota bacterium]MBU1630554.1 ferritin family protein [Candidatus Omnitrophota bacterium]MBU1888738.1 ferritin family protein [Candidatus Omnitrophota bacterium]
MSSENISMGVSEVLQFAIKIEENGWEFYKKFAELEDNEKIRELFFLLSDDEIKHKEIFEEMLSEIETYEPQEVYPPEYFSYLRAYADNIIFKKGIDEQLQKKLDAVAIIDFAMRMELDSIAYYQETKNFVPESQKSIIDRIMEEERKHFLKLANFKNTL